MQLGRCSNFTNYRHDEFLPYFDATRLSQIFWRATWKYLKNHASKKTHLVRSGSHTSKPTLMQCQLPGGGGRGEAAGAAAPPDFRNLCSKSPNHLVYLPTIAPPAPQSWRPPVNYYTLAITLVCQNRKFRARTKLVKDSFFRGFESRIWIWPRIRIRTRIRIPVLRLWIPFRRLLKYQTSISTNWPWPKSYSWHGGKWKSF